MDLIAEENRTVEQLTNRARVTIAYLISAPTESSHAGNRISLRHELEGAYIAQWHHNHDDDGVIADGVPLLRLLVANNGNRAVHWEPVVDQLIELADDPYPLLAVVGLGSSLDTTRQAIARLDAHRIPMVATVITADDMSTTDQPVKHLVRVAPTNTDEVKVAAKYLKDVLGPGVHKPLIVRDANTGDLFTQTLVKAFRDQLKATVREIPDETYDSTLPNIPAAFAPMMANVCQHGPDVVYYAGRGGDLGLFVKAMAKRPCDLHIDIVTGDSAANLANQLNGPAVDTELVASLKSNITLRFTGLAHPDIWHSSFVPALKPNYLRLECEHCFHGLFPNERQDDGRAIMAYDAMQLTITAVQHAIGQTDPRQHDPSTYRGEMVQRWSQFHGTNAIAGASGWISLQNGVPEHKAIPILELTPDSVRFVRVSASSSDGKPFVPAPPNP
ncbi:MAG TPA: ABC transporter substrate-binding protein [Micromonosporaceae bacterium]|nr:ABC transporter substrate-binding protein [Micromonosporaceae bacterium]